MRIVSQNRTYSADFDRTVFWIQDNSILQKLAKVTYCLGYTSMKCVSRKFLRTYIGHMRQFIAFQIIWQRKRLRPCLCHPGMYQHVISSMPVQRYAWWHMTSMFITCLRNSWKLGSKLWKRQSENLKVAGSEPALPIGDVAGTLLVCLLQKRKC